MAGILIALQVDNWNDHREQIAEAREWRDQIIEDLRDKQALAFAETALAGFESDRLVSDEAAWDIALAAYQAG